MTDYSPGPHRGFVSVMMKAIWQLGPGDLILGKRVYKVITKLNSGGHKVKLTVEASDGHQKTVNADMWQLVEMATALDLLAEI